jgi:hypothetical protein
MTYATLVSALVLPSPVYTAPQVGQLSGPVRLSDDRGRSAYAGTNCRSR